MGVAGRGISCAQIMTQKAHNGKRSPFVGPAQPANAHEVGVDTQLAGFYRERYLLAEADLAIEKELQAGRNENPARVTPALGTIR
jgi:hypothetical protein